MRKITDIYEEYKIMPNLQHHQLRVAAVAKQICESLTVQVDTQSIIIACLLHDMGNIIKFRLDHFPEFNEPKGLEYWQNVKDEFISKHGDNEHKATVNIIKELGLSKDIVTLAGQNRFSLLCSHRDSGEMNLKIIHYADSRVGPHGVLSYNDRMDDAGKRYKDYPKKSVEEKERIRLVDCGKEIEKQIFANSNIKPEDITDASIANDVELLKNFTIAILI